MEALSFGVPVVAMLQWMDQPTNAKFIADVWQGGIRAEVDGKGIIIKEEIREVYKGNHGRRPRWRYQKECSEVEETDDGGSQ
ncbi:hypothetical protein V6N13_099896 [Hibiscus sabdariffa]